MSNSNFQFSLHGAWRAAGLISAPRADSSEVTFVCPCCAGNSKLTIGIDSVECPACQWAASGEPWDISSAGAEAAEKHAKKSGLPLWTLSEILRYIPDTNEEIWPGGILSKGRRTAIVGGPGVGKSRMAMQSAIATILGKPFLGWPTNGAGLKWLFLQTENGPTRLQFDLRAMTKYLTIEEKSEVNRCLHILNVDDPEFTSISMAPNNPDRARIESTLLEIGADIVVVDPLRDATHGDLNKDSDMTDVCKWIAATVRTHNPKAVSIIIHHGRTGASEASKVFGDDSASFARNSKVLFGWLRSQINIAQAGDEWPGVVIVGCGKNSDGKKWEEFAAEMVEDTMSYRRLTNEEFDLAAWQKNMGTETSKRKASEINITSGQVLAVLVKNGGKSTGATRYGVFSKLVKAAHPAASLSAASEAIIAAITANIIYMDDRGVITPPPAPCATAPFNGFAKPDSDSKPFPVSSRQYKINKNKFKPMQAQGE